MESPERGKPLVGIAMEFPVTDGSMSCSPPTVPTWLRRRLSESKAPSPSTVEEIEAKLRDADLRRQKFYENLVSKARPKPRSPTRSASHSDDLGHRLEAKLLAAEEKRLSILTNAQLRLAKLDELRQVAKTEAEMRFKQERAELGTKAKMRVQKAEANRLLILRTYRQRRASVKERISQSLLRQMACESKYKERVRAAIFQKRAAAEKKRLGLLEAEKSRAHARSMQVQKAANFLSHQRDMDRRELKNKLEDRLQKARRRRADYLMQRGRSYNNAAVGWNLMHEQAEMLSIKLARCWRKFTKLRKTTALLAKNYNDLYINEKSVKSMPFEQLALVIQSPTVLRTVKALLDRLECRYKLLRGVGSAPNSSSWDDIDHLLKRVGSPRRKNTPTPRKIISGRETKNTGFSGQAGNSAVSFSRYQVRVVLCAYMILGHPEAVISGRGERETALLKSAEKFVLELDLLIKILLNGPLDVPNEKFDDSSVLRRTFRIQLSAFDSAWCSFLNSFVVWKSKDARSLEEDLVRAACRLELSMIQTCKMTPEGVSAPLSHDMKAIQKQVSEDQKLLREKVLHLSGDAGIERMENALADTRMKFFNSMENRSTAEPLTKPIVSQKPVSFAFGSTGDTSTLTVNAHKQSYVVRSLFRDEVNDKEASPSTSRNDITQSSLQSMDMENVMIVNEYVHGGHLEFADSSNSVGGSGNNIMAKLKQTMENAFWDAIIQSVRQCDPNYTRVVDLMREVRDEICAMAPFSWRLDIFEAIDVEILTQVLNSGKLDIDYFGKILEFALITLQKLSAPAYENELKEKHQQFMAELVEARWANDSSENSNVITLIKGLRFVLEEIQELKQEISKARIRMLEPFLKGPEALYFLGKSFTSRYGHPSNAINELPLTIKWLSFARDGRDEELNDHQKLISELTTGQESSSNYLPSFTLRTGGNFLVTMGGKQVDASSTSNATNYLETIELEHNQEEVDLLVRLGLLKLVRQIAGLTEDELPETIILNLSRLRSVQSQVQKIIVMATSLLVLRQTLVSQRIVTSQAHMDSILSSTVKRLSECLDSAADAGIQDIIEILSTTVDKDDKSVDPNHELMKEIMARMLNKSLQEDDPVFTRVSRAAYLAARGLVLGENIKQGKELAEMALQKVGATLLLDEVVQAASVLAVTAKVSVLVHGPWYANLLKQ